MQFDGRTVLVTGGASGIGLALSKQLLACKAKIVVLGRDPEKLQGLADVYPGQVFPYVVDLANRQEVATFIETASKNHPDISVLINNAGVQEHTDFTKPLSQTYVDNLFGEVTINFTSLVYLCHGLMPVLAKHDQAMIINISSGLALSPKRSAPVYCATKAAVRSFSKALRYQCERDLPQVKIVDAVMALVDTGMTTGRGRNKISPDAAAQEVLIGAAKEKKIIWVGKSKLLAIIHRLAPSLADRILRDG